MWVACGVDAFDITHILGRSAPFCEHDEAKLRSAVLISEGRESRLGGYESAWGACALLSRALSHRCPRKPRGQRRQGAAASPGAAVASAPAVDGGGCNSGVVPAAGDGDGTDGAVVPAAGAEQQMPHQQVEFLNQLE